MKVIEINSKTIIMIAKSGTYKKRFIYQEAEIKITNHDLIVNQ